MAKNSWFAAFLSLVVSGFGQLYLGLFWRAGFFLALELLTTFLYFYFPSFGLILNFFVSIWSAIDAYNRAEGKSKMENEIEKSTPILKVY